tara:strand:+ start:2352 stop:3452 length:1101 start_codon:yes stop_codon:yes gene_type:complete
MGSLQYSDYQMIFDPSAMSWVMFGYLGHILLAVLQGWLICAMLASSAINLLGRGDWLWLRCLGALTQLPVALRRPIGLLQLLLAAALIAPLALQASYVWSLSAAVGVALMVLSLRGRRLAGSGRAGNVARPMVLVFAVLCVAMTTFERKDNLAFALDIAFKAKYYRDHEIAWQVASDKQSPKLGDQAADFQLPSVGGELYSLSEFYGDKPTVLFFGANSCPAFSEGTLGLNRLQAQFGDRVNFVGVYVREPHPVDEWWLTPSRWTSWLHRVNHARAAVDILQPQLQEERDYVARRAKKNLLNNDITLLIDGVDNAVNNRWTGQPTRIYLLDKRGRVIYNPGMGPYAFNPDYLKAELERVLVTTEDN